MTLVFTIGLRSLYTAEALGLDGYMTARSKTAVNFHGTQMKEKFRSRMQEFASADSTSLVFTDDLKTMLNLAENTPEDIKLLHQMIEKYLQFSSY
jgi:pentatricopeptide repeat domain-containing protein 2